MRSVENFAKCGICQIQVWPNAVAAVRPCLRLSNTKKYWITQRHGLPAVRNDSTKCSLGVAFKSFCLAIVAATQSQQSVYRTSDTGAPASPKTHNGPLSGPFFGRNGPLREVWGFEISTRDPNLDPFLGFGLPPSWGGKRSKCEHTKNQKITQRIDPKCMFFDTSCLKTVLSLPEEKKAHRKYAYSSKLWLLIFALCFLPFAERS